MPNRPVEPREAVGVVAAITPRNRPQHQIAAKVAAAMAVSQSVCVDVAPYLSNCGFTAGTFGYRGTGHFDSFTP